MVEKAVDWLRDTAEDCALKRATRLHLDDYSASLKSLIMSEHLAEPVNAQERYARQDIRYLNHLELLKVAVFEDEKARYLREAADAKIRVWQTESSNARGRI